MPKVRLEPIQRDSVKHVQEQLQGRQEQCEDMANDVNEAKTHFG